MNICHVITRLIVGGAQENTVLTCRGLAERGHRVTLIAGPETGAEGSLWPDAERFGGEAIRLDSLRRAVSPWYDFRARAQLIDLFGKLRPDVVHTHSSKAGILARSAARAAQVPFVVHTIHGMSFNRTQSPTTQWIYRVLERRAARYTHAIVTVADAMIEQSVAAGIAPRNRFTTIRSGMETDRFAPNAQHRTRLRENWPFPPDCVIAGTVARLFENKGYDDLIAAMPAAVAACPNLRFVWIGDGPHRERYLQRLVELNLRDRVHLTGLIPPTELPFVLSGLDFVAHASRWEGLARVLVQALLTELPVISFDNDGAPEVVTPGVTGILVPMGDTQRLGRGMIELTKDPDLRRSMGAAGRAACLDRFDWRRMVDEIEQLYAARIAQCRHARHT